MKTIMTNGKVTIVEWTYDYVDYFYNKDNTKEGMRSEELWSDENGSYFVDSKGKKHYENDFEKYIDE